MCKTRLSKGFEQCRRPGPDQGVVAIVEVSRTLGKYSTALHPSRIDRVSSRTAEAAGHNGRGLLLAEKSDMAGASWSSMSSSPTCHQEQCISQHPLIVVRLLTTVDEAERTGTYWISISVQDLGQPASGPVL